MKTITTTSKLTMARAVDAFAKAMQTKARAPKTIHNSLAVINAWLRAMKLQTAAPASVTEHQIAKWVNRKGESAAGTRKANLAAIRTFFGFLCDKGWVEGNPSNLVGVDYSVMSRAQKERVERQPFTAQEIKRVLVYIKKQMDWASDEIAKLSAKVKRHEAVSSDAVARQERIELMRFWDFAVRLSHDTGLRLGDICQLEWSCFSNPNFLSVWTDKTNTRIEVPVSNALLELVAEIPVEHPKYVFPKQREIILDAERRSLMSVQFSRLCKAAGVKGKTFHCLRHTAATNQFSKSDKDELARKLAEVMTVGQIAQMLGHSSTKVTGKYIHE